MLRLTKKQRAVYGAIAALIAENGCSPSVREIMRRVGLASSSAAFQHVRALQRKGFIAQRDGLPRTLRIVRPMEEAS